MKDEISHIEAPKLESGQKEDAARVEVGPPKIKGAQVGDRGRVIGAISHEGNGLLRLVLSVAPGEMVLLSGGFQRIQEILDTFLHHTLEVVPGAGTSYGFHDVRLVKDEEGPVKDQNERLTDDGGVS